MTALLSAAKIQNLNSKNFNKPTRKQTRRYLAPQLGNATYETRYSAVQDFLPEFKTFLHAAGISPQLQRNMGFEFTLACDPRWNTSACDNISARCRYLGGHFVVWSNGSKQDGTFEMHLYGDLPSGKYRSGACTTPEELGRKFALLVCEAERIADLRWWHRVPENAERFAQILITFFMCVSFFITPDNDWEKADYFTVFLGLTACAMLSYVSRIKPDDALIDGEINQQAIAV